MWCGLVWCALSISPHRENRNSAECLLELRGDAQLTLAGSSIWGNSTLHNLTMRAQVQGSGLVFEGNTQDANELTLAWPAMTADRRIIWPDRTFDDAELATTSGLTNDRVALVDNGGDIITSSNLQFDGSTINFNGPASASVTSTTGPISLSASTSLGLTANSGAISIQAPHSTTDIALTTPHATGGDLLATAADDITVTATDQVMSWVTAAATASGSTTIHTGDASSGVTGSITLATGDNTEDWGTGDIVVLVQTTDDAGGDVSMFGGDSTHSSGTGGGMNILGGDATHVFIESSTGGTVSVLAGDSGSSAGGDVDIRPGTGSTPGSVIIKSGASTIVSLVDAGATDITATDDITTTSTGSVSFSTAAALTAESDSGIDMVSDAAISLLAAATSTSITLTGGDASIQVGSSTVSSANLVLLAGDTSASATGGPLTIDAGAATAAAVTGGAVSILAGGGTSTGGSIKLRGGATGAGTDGDVILRDGTHATTPNNVLTIGDNVVISTVSTFSVDVRARARACVCVCV